MRNLQKSYHSVFSINYHIIFVTKYRRKCLKDEHLLFLKNVCANKLTEIGCDLIEFGGESDHIHLLITTPPTITLSKLINILKSLTSRKLREAYSEYLSLFYWKNTLWTRSYCVISVGDASKDVITKYIQNQGK